MHILTFLISWVLVSIPASLIIAHCFFGQFKYLDDDDDISPSM